jgi:RimJ/RimL family protein N-acetyltransferase
MQSDIVVRALTPTDWLIFRSIRLRALQEHPGVYLSCYKDAVKIPEAEWQETLDGNRKCVFGLFEQASSCRRELIGIAAIFTWRDDPTGRTGIMAMDYVDAKHRGRGLARLLYRSRIDWALDQAHLTQLVISHRKGNEASRRAMLSFGFKYQGKHNIRWPDGMDDEEWNYALDLEVLRQRVQR